METSIMNTYSKFGYNKVVLHTMRILLHICEICRKKQWEVLCICQKSKPSCLVFVGELPNGPNGVVHPKMNHLVCYTHFGPILN